MTITPTFRRYLNRGGRPTKVTCTVAACMHWEQRDGRQVPIDGVSLSLTELGSDDPRSKTFAMTANEAHRLAELLLKYAAGPLAQPGRDTV